MPYPIFLSNPVCDFWFAQSIKARDVTNYMPFKKNGLCCDAVVAQDHSPVLHEGIPVRRILGRKRGHMVSVWVQLLLKEYGEVGFCHIPQWDIASHRTFSINLGARLATSSSRITLVA